MLIRCKLLLLLGVDICKCVIFALYCYVVAVYLFSSVSVGRKASRRSAA